MTLRLLTLGVGDAFSALHYSTSFAIESDGRWLLIDCPHPVRKMLREAATRAGVQVDLDAIDGVVVTHLHADHSSGLESLGYFNRFALRRRATLLAHPSVSARLWDDHLAAGMDRLKPSAEADPHAMAFSDYFDQVSLDEGKEITFGPFAMSCRRTVHHVPTTAIRVRVGDKSVAYSADTTFDRGLIDWLCESDLVLHETGYGIHTPYDQLASLPAKLRSKMRLIHYPDEHEAEPEILRPVTEGMLLSV